MKFKKKTLYIELCFIDKFWDIYLLQDMRDFSLYTCLEWQKLLFTNLCYFNHFRGQQSGVYASFIQ